MVIAYLQHCNIVPSLQQGVLEPNIVEAIDPKYRRKCIKTINVNVGYNKPQVESQEIHTIWNGDYGVASLLIGFFFYYGYQHTYAPDSWVSVSAGGFVKGKPLWDNDFAQQLVVVDPFETDRNVCSAVEESLPVIINEFRRAYNFLSMNQFEEAFKEIRRSRNGNGRRRGTLIVFKG
jgi:DNA polymerase sigma